MYGEIPKIELELATCNERDGMGDKQISFLQISLRCVSIGLLWLVQVDKKLFQ